MREFIRHFIAALVIIGAITAAHAINIIGLPQQPVVATGSSAGTATFNADAGVVTTTALTLTTGTSATLTINNNQISSSSVLSVEVYNGTNTAGVPFIASITPSPGSVAIVITNAAATGVAALNGTLKVMFVIFN